MKLCATSCSYVKFVINNLNFTSVSFKGFMMELPVDFQHVKQNQIVDDGCLLFIPSKSVSKQKVFFE